MKGAVRALALGAALAHPGAAHALDVDIATVPLSYEHWTLRADGANGGTETLGQFTFSASAQALVASETRVRLDVRPSWSTEDPMGGSTRTLESFGDLDLQVSRRAGDRLILQGGLSLPTGHSGLSPEEFALAQVLAHPLLELKARTPGEGTGVRVGTMFGGFLSAQSTYSIGLGAVYRGEFELLKGRGAYRPTPEVALSGGIERRAGESVCLGLDATVRFFGQDRWEGREVYREGDELDVEGRWAGSTSRYRGTARLRVVTKRADTVLLPEGSIRRELVQSPGTSLVLETGADRRLGARWQLGLAVEGRIFTGSDLPAEDGQVLGVGPTFTWGPIGGGRCRLQCKFDAGSVQGGADRPDLSLRGFSIQASYWPATSERREGRKADTKP